MTTEHRRLFTSCDEADILELDVDNTSFQSIQACGRHAFNELILGRVSNARAPLDYGAALHVGLETWQRTSDVDLATQALIAYWRKLPKYDMGWRTMAQAVETFTKYTEEYKKPYTLWDHDGTTLIETGFRLHLADIDLNVILRDHPRSVYVDSTKDASGYHPDEYYLPIRKVRVFFTGRLDVLAKISGKPVLVDFKTCSVPGSGFWDYFQLSPQFTGYLKALSQMGIKCNDFLIDALITTKPTATGTAISFSRQSFTRSKQLTDRWEHDFISSVKYFLHHLSTGVIHNYQSCITKYGRCAYYDVCTMPNDTAATSLLNSSFYSPRTWSPLDDR